MNPAEGSNDEPALVVPLAAVLAVGVLIDRREHLESINDFLINDARRSLILQGLPGIGKTALGAYVAKLARPHVDAILWLNCRTDQASADQLFAKLNMFLEGRGDRSLSLLWRDRNPAMLPVKLDKLIGALDVQRYLLVLEEFQNWLGLEGRITNDQSREVLSHILRSAQRSKLLLGRCLNHVAPCQWPVRRIS
jgi:hypothetical protein